MLKRDAMRGAVISLLCFVSFFLSFVHHVLSDTSTRRTSRVCAHAPFTQNPNPYHSFKTNQSKTNQSHFIPSRPQLRHAPLNGRQLLLLLCQGLLRRRHQFGRGLGQESGAGETLLQALIYGFVVAGNWFVT